MYNYEKKIDLVDLMLKYFPNNSNEQKIIKSYMESHKENCNNFMYSRFKEQSSILNSIFFDLLSDIGSEICKVLASRKEI